MKQVRRFERFALTLVSHACGLYADYRIRPNHEGSNADQAPILKLFFQQALDFGRRFGGLRCRRGLTEDREQNKSEANLIFDSHTLTVMRSIAYVVRSSRASSQGLLEDLQRAVWSYNRILPLDQVRTLDDIYNKSLARILFTLVLLAIAGSMALAIGLVEVYGVVSYTVSQRKREVGIRVTLGASRRQH